MSTVCKAGHMLTSENLTPDGKRCLMCKRAAARASYHRGKSPRAVQKALVRENREMRARHVSYQWNPTAQRHYRVKISGPVRLDEATKTFERDYAPLRGKMTRWARTRVRSWNEREDVVQDALVVIWQKIVLGRPDNNPEAFAFQTLRNAVSAWQRTNLVYDGQGWAARWNPPNCEVTIE